MNIASKNSFVEEIKEFIEIVDERIRRLSGKTLDVSEKVREVYDGQIDKLKAQREELAIKAQNISEASEEKWGEIKDTIHNDYELYKDEVEVTYESISFQYKLLKKNSNGFGKQIKTKMIIVTLM